MKKKVLCVEDDSVIQTLVEASLGEFEVLTAASLKEAPEVLAEHQIAAILMDIELPDGDGLRFLTEVMKEERLKRTPVLILTGHSEISNKVMAFSFGADDFISKPFDPIELNARVAAKVRKKEADESLNQIREIEDIVIDFNRQKAFQKVKNKEIELGLTSLEFKILSLLTRRLEQVFSREQIMNQVWGQTFITDRTVDSHVAHLRQKIEQTSLRIDTVKSFGYRAITLKKLGQSSF